MIDFPDWISIVDLNENEQVGGYTNDNNNDDNDDDDEQQEVSTEVLQQKIKNIFDKIEKDNKYQVVIMDFENSLFDLTKNNTIDILYQNYEQILNNIL